MGESRWGGSPEGIVLDYLPLMRSDNPGPDEERQLREIASSEIVILADTGQYEMQALLCLATLTKQRQVPLVLTNPNGIQNRNNMAGQMMKRWSQFESTLTSTFHLEQFDPPEE